MIVKDFVAQVKSFQCSIGLNDKEFALSIGRQPYNWCKIQKGTYEPTVPFLQGLWRTYPEARGIIVAYLDGE